MDKFSPNDKTFPGKHLGYVEEILESFDLAYLIDNSQEIRVMIRPSDFDHIKLVDHQTVEFTIDDIGHVTGIRVL
jgi:hypothetical protein